MLLVVLEEESFDDDDEEDDDVELSFADELEDAVLSDEAEALRLSVR